MNTFALVTLIFAGALWTFNAMWDIHQDKHPLLPALAASVCFALAALTAVRH